MEINKKDLDSLLDNFTKIQASAGEMIRLYDDSKLDNLNYTRATSVVKKDDELKKVFSELCQLIDLMNIKLSKAEKLYHEVYGKSQIFNRRIPPILCKRQQPDLPSESEALSIFHRYYTDSEWTSYMDYKEFSDLFKKFSIPLIMEGLAMAQIMDLYEGLNE